MRVLLAMSLEGVMRGVVMGFNRVALARRWEVHVVPPASLERSIAQSNADAVVLTEAAWGQVRKRSLKGLAALAVGVDLTAHDIPSVVADERLVGAEAAEHLLGKGLRSFAVFEMGALGWSQRRAEGFRGAITRAGFGCADGGLFDAEGHPPFNHDTARRWLDSLPKPVGVLACCDVWGWLLALECRLMEVAVPDEVSIVGVDNDRLTCTMTYPPLSSVPIPWLKMGREAALLAERLRRGKGRRRKPIIISPAPVVARRSSDLIAVEQPEVAQALRFIRERFDRPIGVPDVLRKVVVRRRALEQAFRQQLGHTILQEIHRVRIEHAKRLLSSTDLSMPEVAEKCGYSNATRLGISFQKQTGQTPSSYRKQFHLRD